MPQDKRLWENNPPDQFPLISLVTERDEGRSTAMCPACSSSLKRKWWFKVLGCIQPECVNYYKKTRWIMEMEKVPIKATARKLKKKWTIEITDEIIQ